MSATTHHSEASQDLHASSQTANRLYQKTTMIYGVRPSSVALGLLTLSPHNLCSHGGVTMRWLTELQCRKTQEEVTQEAAPAKAKDDEDGPGSSEAEEVKDFTDDDESTPSTDEEKPTNDALSIPTFVGFFEKQRDARCGLHALNNCVGGCRGTAQTQH